MLNLPVASVVPPFTAGPSWQTWSDSADLDISAQAASHASANGRSGGVWPREATESPGTASILVVASWRTLASRRLRGRHCAPPTPLSPSPFPSWGREAECGKMEKSSSCPEICQVHYQPNARAPTQRKSMWSVCAWTHQRSSVSLLRETPAFWMNVHTFLSLSAERCALTQVQCSRGRARTSLDHKVTASSDPPTAARTSLFISQSERRFTQRGKCLGGTGVISEFIQDVTI